MEFELFIEYEDFLIFRLKNKDRYFYVNLEELEMREVELIHTDYDIEDKDLSELLNVDFDYDITGEAFHEPHYCYFKEKQETKSLIQTKYKTGQKVWVILANQVKETQIDSITIFSDDNLSYYCKYIDGERYYLELDEKEIFSTPEEAQEKLTQKINNTEK